MPGMAKSAEICLQMRCGAGRRWRRAWWYLHRPDRPAATGIFGTGVSEMKTAEAMRRYREGEAGDPVFERLLGIEMKREQYTQGAAFCDTVVELTDEATLALMWESAETLPSLPEIEEPRLWLARSA